ncbi:dimethylaniline monooxygenase [N-oxide-forming] 5 [Coleophoma cylindrospora]|uniref:Dimethylaniline monooxygenase [N-oxide-forming] 5 n=1 Tax=Coleophoma cylindrospora TaxID=1849047 RepID=A0A3D8RLW6_9HELO|nr:dimethylaniline monooxygenase [N-oxide-forming] 5 [Coleophoma cylindrospora]
MDRSKTKIAIVGGGPAGMTALKELRELGFDVTLFERRNNVGGIWAWSEDRSITTALKQTQVCNNKYGMALSEFPMSPEYPSHLSAPQMGSYFQSYAKHFDLYKNVEFGKTVTKFERVAETSKWQVTFADETDTPRSFDKVVWATGGFLRPKSVVFEGQDQFAGRIIHSQDVRNLEEFKDQNVIVLGIGNTAGDITINLVHHAKNVYISHRRGTKIFKRVGADGLPADLMMTPTISAILWWIEAYMPWLFGKIMDSAMDGNFKDSWGENKAAWGFAQSPSIGDGVHIVVCNDDLIPLVKEGKVTSTKGIKRIVGPKAVELDDGTVIQDVDTIIACVGYTDDMGMLADALTFVDAPGEAAPLPNLYMGIFPPEHSDSVAIASNVHLNGPQIPGRELGAMAIAQIWAGHSSLPSKLAMDAWVGKQQDWLRKRIVRSPGLHRGEVPQIQWMYFVHNAAGTGLYDNIGWSWKAWKLWWNDRELYNALAHGPSTSHGFRIFETGKRTAWKDARQALLDVNAEVKMLKQAASQKKTS